MPPVQEQKKFYCNVVNTTVTGRLQRVSDGSFSDMAYACTQCRTCAHYNGGVFLDIPEKLLSPSMAVEEIATHLGSRREIPVWEVLSVTTHPVPGAFYFLNQKDRPLSKRERAAIQREVKQDVARFNREYPNL